MNLAWEEGIARKKKNKKKQSLHSVQAAPESHLPQDREQATHLPAIPTNRLLEIPGTIFAFLTFLSKEAIRAGAHALAPEKR